jgi:hypothetical protein
LGKLWIFGALIALIAKEMCRRNAKEELNV